MCMGGRRCAWEENTVEDLVGIKEHFQENISFHKRVKYDKQSVLQTSDSKNQKNNELHLGKDQNFDVAQIREKFQRCVSECLKAIPMLL